MKAILLAVLTVFAGLQFIRPEKQSLDVSGADDLFAHTNPPVEVRGVLLNACYDCHSLRTRYPWYTEIQPVGWMLTKHVREGRRALNLSHFGKLSPTRAARRLEDCADEVSSGHMPPASYKTLHPESRLTAAQIDAFVGWATREAETLRGDDE